MTVIKLERKGKEQSIVLPAEYSLAGDEVYVKQIGNAIVIFPKENPWYSFFESLDLFSDDYMTNRVQPMFDKRKIVHSRNNYS